MLLENNAAIANRFFPTKVGVIEPGAAADLAILDYIPPTDLHTANFLGHFIFGMVDATVDTTICNGKVLMERKEIKVKWVILGVKERQEVAGQKVRKETKDHVGILDLLVHILLDQEFH